jgi:nucleoside-diphosphate-sugar epimerase
MSESNRRMEHALVSGGAGFIGSHLCAALLERGATVTCLDNLRTGRRENVAELLGHPRFRLLELDVTQDLPRSARAAFASLPPTRVFHLASPASVIDYLRYPLETLRVNSEGTWKLLDLARAHGARFLLASTSEIYGDPLEHPQTEIYWGNVNPCGPRSCYDEGKRFGESLTLQYWRSHGVDARIVRIFNTYGPHSRLDDGRVVPNFVGQALDLQPITIYGDGEQTRSFCYVDDLVAGLLAVMDAGDQQGEVFNLGNPEEHTILEFAAIVGRLCAEVLGRDAPVPLEWRDLPVDDPTRRQPDIGKARTRLGWEPVVSLEDGLRRTIAWFARHVTGPNGGPGDRAARVAPVAARQR